MTYGPAWDRPHSPSDDRLWQESDCYWFFDERAGVGGFHRVGQHPNGQMGSLTVFAFDRQMRFHHTRDYPAADCARSADGQIVGPSDVTALDNERMRYRWDLPDCEADLEFYESFYLPRDWSRSGHGASVHRHMNAGGHLECSGRLRGTVRIAGRTHQVDALAHRDRSWGARDHNVVAQHRMYSGTVGPSLSWAGFTMTLRTGAVHASGFVVRNGVEHDLTAIRVLTTFDNDGVTTTGATGLLDLETGERLIVPCRAVQGFVTDVSGAFHSTDTISRVVWNGAVGFCDLEVSNNSHRGSFIPGQADVSSICVDQGLSALGGYADCDR